MVLITGGKDPLSSLLAPEGAPQSEGINGFNVNIDVIKIDCICVACTCRNNHHPHKAKHILTATLLVLIPPEEGIFVRVQKLVACIETHSRPNNPYAVADDDDVDLSSGLSLIVLVQEETEEVDDCPIPVGNVWGM